MVLTLLLIDFKGFLFSNPWVRDDPMATGQSRAFELFIQKRIFLDEFFCFPS